MGGFVEKTHKTYQNPEFNQVGNAFMSEVVEFQTVPSNFSPTVNPDLEHKRKQHDIENHEAASKDEPQLGVSFGEEHIRIPGRKIDLGQIAEA